MFMLLNAIAIRQAVQGEMFHWKGLATRIAQSEAWSFLFRLGLTGGTLLCVIKTGWVHSPLLWLLYLPVLHAALRDRPKLGLGIGLVIAAFYTAAIMGESNTSGPDNMAAIGVALSFPAVSIFASAFNLRHDERIVLLHNRADELTSLLDMAQMMDAAVDLDMTLNLILLNVQSITNCDLSAVYLKDDSGTHLELKAASGPRDYLAFEPSIRISATRYAQWSIEDLQNGKPASAFYARDSRAVTRRLWLFELVPEARSFVCIPLAGVEGLLGMLYIGFNVPNGLGNVPLERLEHLATRAAFPLHRALVQQGYQSLAYIDSKTGLDNFRRFEENLSEELIRSQRYHHELSVILLDVDHFKQFNDKWGHPAGDTLLAQLAVVLRDSLRNVDRLARYGGEEFVIICPETSKVETRLVAERIRRNVANKDFTILGPDGERVVHVTVSIGYSAYPLDSETSEDLVSKADAALYQAKEAGRNTTCPSGGAAWPAQTAA